ncbi:MAG: 4Fe-4S binding protein [Prolixibacteraceae bacterium]|nr:4Fe-4S binding protein [Prolixibacteraceae bacterium]
MIREIVKIDEELCDGCGVCVPNCHEGALLIIDGKARLVSELMCDGLGACIGHCPKGAITIEKREADKYDEQAVIAQMVKSGKNTVFAHLKHLQDHGENGYLKQALDYIKTNSAAMPFTIDEVHRLLHGKKEQKIAAKVVAGVCPGSSPESFKVSGMALATQHKEMQSELTHWPVQLHLINPAAGWFYGADLLIAADCAGFAHGDFHGKYMSGKKVVIACPKLDHGKEIYLKKFISLIDGAEVNTITVAVMEVPCCGGLISLVKSALSFAKRSVPVKVAVISTRGEVLSENWIPETQAV